MYSQSQFKPAWWLRNPHLQTVWATVTRRQTKIETQRERLELPDGDYLDLDWAGTGHGPIVLILHGMGGSIESPYSRGFLRAITENGWRGVLMHFRGCSGEPNRLPRLYHSGETEDIAYVVQTLKNREPDTPLAAIGVSLGGSVLINWLGKHKKDKLLVASVAISVPFELKKAANHINKGLSRFYQWYILRDLRRTIINKFKIMKAPIDFGDIERLNTFWEFDNKITAPLHGFLDVHDYYEKASCRPYLKQIEIPTLILQARDDPFMSPDVIPEPQELSEQVTLEVSETGGHVGFVAGTIPWRPVYWMEQRAIEYLKEHLPA